MRAFSGTAVATADAGHLEPDVTKGDARPHFPAVFHELRPYVHSVLRGLGVPKADLEDVCQDVFVVVHRKLATYEDRGALRSWIYGICVRASLHARRRRARSPDVGSEALPEAIDSTTPAEQATAAQGRQILYAILDQLDDDKRAVFVLYELEELTMAEVAKALEINMFTAYSRLRSARAEVQQAIVRFSRANGAR
ncbi:RNA polymerase sigma factor RpoE [Labilithrix luteola]|uniref:RNA polymerase sigma factor RpoE n=1 Tax=Labilithrix luteola TaxID=1391654 RepID=A0A0K1QF28_9BACT|nr:sigma-70 family RNA polymerase sigma factor [Labilithrix luteola]AKV04369.1 RNA polymerase sigma factor RpoE [Labilithrix luteola]